MRRLSAISASRAAANRSRAPSFACIIHSFHSSEQKHTTLCTGASFRPVVESNGVPRNPVLWRSPMKAAVVHSYNAPPGYADFADPAPTSDEVLVTVAAAGLHQIVKSLANGKHYLSTGNFPFVPGVDGVGRLEDG